MVHTLSHPGAILAESLEDLGISVTEAAKDLGISRQMLSGILNQRRPITPETAVRIGHYIGNGAEIWARMQTNYDLRIAEKAPRATVKKIPRIDAA
jgi:addiction module HigA family antidote